MEIDETPLLCSHPLRKNFGDASCGSPKGRNSLLEIQLGFCFYSHNMDTPLECWEKGDTSYLPDTPNFFLEY